MSKAEQLRRLLEQAGNEAVVPNRASVEIASKIRRASWDGENGGRGIREVGVAGKDTPAQSKQSWQNTLDRASRLPGEIVGGVMQLPGALLNRTGIPGVAQIGSMSTIPGAIVSRYPRAVGLPVIGLAGGAIANTFSNDDRANQSAQEVMEGIPDAQSVNTSDRVVTQQDIANARMIDAANTAGGIGMDEQKRSMLRQQAEAEVQAQLEEQYKKNLKRQYQQEERSRAIADGYGI